MNDYELRSLITRKNQAGLRLDNLEKLGAGYTRGGAGLPPVYLSELAAARSAYAGLLEAVDVARAARAR